MLRQKLFTVKESNGEIIAETNAPSLAHAIQDLLNNEEDLTGAVIENTTFKNMALHNCTLVNAQFKNVKLFNVGLKGDETKIADLAGVEFINSKLSWNTNMDKASLKGALFIKTESNALQMRHALLEYATISETTFKNSTLIGTNFTSAIVEDSEFTGGTLSNTNWDSATLKNVKFKNVNLLGADLSKAKMENVDFTGANIKNTKFHHSIIKNPTFKKAKNYADATFVYRNGNPFIMYFPETQKGLTKNFAVKALKVEKHNRAPKMLAPKKVSINITQTLNH